MPSEPQAYKLVRSCQEATPAHHAPNEWFNAVIMDNPFKGVQTGDADNVSTAAAAAQALLRALPGTVSGSNAAQALLDSPFPYCFDELFAANPTAKVILSLRNATRWAISRKARQGTDKICRWKPECPANADVVCAPHRMSVVSCLLYTGQGSDDAVQGKFVPINTIHTEELALAYEEYNTHVINMVPSPQLKVLNAIGLVQTDGIEQLSSLLSAFLCGKC
jgi:hypothetical protein